tara:strand:+ start:184 stop:1350 length:1167 start_codon:yes stop_codon:yes gene_type:complete
MSPPLIQGIVASLGIHTFVDACFASTIVRQRSGRCFFLNGALFLGSIGVFDWVIGPAARAAAARSDWALLALGRGAATDDAVVQRVSSATVDAVASTTFQLAWLLPIYVTSMLLSGAWYSDLADAARQLHSERDRGEQARGSASAAPAAALRVKAPKKKRRTTAADPEAAIADEIYRTLFLVVVLLQATLCALIPIVGQLLTFCLLSWTYAFYSFDYKWSAMGWRVAQRIAHIEHHWLYFLGFGAPFTLATFYWSTFVGAALFQTLFPLVRCVCVLRARRARPLSFSLARTHAPPRSLFSSTPPARSTSSLQARAVRETMGAAARTSSEGHCRRRGARCQFSGACVCAGGRCRCTASIPLTHATPSPYTRIPDLTVRLLLRCTLPTLQ